MKIAFYFNRIVRAKKEKEEKKKRRSGIMNSWKLRTFQVPLRGK